VALAVAFSLLAAACGSDKKSTSTTATTSAATTATTTAGTTASTTAATTAGTTADTAASTSAATTPATTAAGGGGAATGSPVTVLALLDLSSASPSPTGTDKVVKATVDAINAKGGLAGHKVVLDMVDTKGDAPTVLAAIAEAASKNPVAVLEDSPTTETASSDALAALGIPIIGEGYSPSVWGGSAGTNTCATAPANFCAKANHLTITTTLTAVVAEQVLGAQAAGAKKLGVASCAEVDSCSSAVPIFDGVAKALGLESVGSTKVSSSAADYTAECIAWVQQGVDFIQISGGAALGVKLMESCGDQGYNGIWGASAGSVSGDLIKQPFTLAGGLNAFPWWVDDAPVKTFRDAMTAGGASADDYSNPVATGLYSAMLLLQKAIADHASSGTLDGKSALAAMYQVKDETLGGLIAPVTFTADNLDRNRDCFWPYVKDKDNKFTNPLGGLKYQCFPPKS
jgi:branched-chain amino acid transport system substrate-binding protein